MGLLVLLLMPFLGTQAWYGWERWQLRQRVRAQLFAELPDSALECLRFSVGEARARLRWERDDEFVLDGQWYDVARRAWQGDTLLLWCVPDHAETAIEKAQQQQLMEALADHTPLRKTLQRMWLFFFGLFEQKAEVLLNAGVFSIKQKPVETVQANHAQLRCAPPSPPPEGGLLLKMR
ncbi:MAG: hypothetical protein RMJ33_07175 [Saprospiraceae bacterium]|nr:hypothetical protein [Saprospiraceae bacterium]MDW8229603.1 hypothetical protein [Saprospiraceae bacterium]